MSGPKLVSMQVRPKRSADIGFSAPGVIDKRYDDTNVGSTTTPYDLEKLIADLSAREVVAGRETGLLLWDEKKIRIEIEKNAKPLFRLQSDTVAYSLNQAIHQRRIRFLRLYQNSASITGAALKLKNDKLLSINALGQNLFAQHDAIDKKYHAGTPPPAAAPVTTTSYKGSFVSNTNIDKVVQAEHKVFSYKGLPGDPQTAHVETSQSIDTVITQPYSQTTTTEYDNTGSVAAGTKYNRFSHETVGQEVRDLVAENHIRYSRDMIEFLNRQYTETIVSFGLEKTAEILDSELRIIDSEINKLQIELINRYLLAPFFGRIVTIYGEVGEAVAPGVAVLRIESEDKILLVARIRSSLALIPGSTKAKITTTGFFRKGTSPVKLSPILGDVVSVRGHDAEIDQWDVTIEADNSTAPRLPINYEFDPDPDMTTIEFL